MEELTITSPAFESNKLIPSKYTCDGDNVNPTLNVNGIPEKQMKSFCPTYSCRKV